MSAPNIYTLAQGFADLTVLLEQIDETGADEQSTLLINNWLAKLDGEVAGKLESVGKFLRIQEMTALAADTEVERLRVRSLAAKRRVTRVKAAVLELLRLARLPRVETDTFTFTVAGNGGKAPVVVDAVDPDEVARTHPHLVVVRTEINTDAVRAELEAGKPLPFARLSERGQHLRVK